MCEKESAVLELDNAFSGAKAWPEGLDPAQVLRAQILGAHGVQIKIEKDFLRHHDVDPVLIDSLASHWGDKTEWLDSLNEDKTKLNIFWGSARDKVLTNPELKPCIDILECLALELAGDKESVIHGSSTTGFMGLSDSLFLKAATAVFGKIWEKFVRIYTIPLHWTVGKDQQRETASKNGSRRYRCPPHMKITDRTADFFAKFAARVIVLPGGLGTLFEIAFLLISWQLRGLLVTVASGWKKCPPCFLIDFKDDDKEYFWEGIRILLKKMEKIGVIDQKDIDTMYIIRVGSGENIDSRSGSQQGIRVCYFTDAEAAAQFIKSKK